MSLPHFSYGTLSKAYTNPVYINLFESRTYDKEFNTNIGSDEIFDITFDYDNNSDTVTLLIYNNENALLSLDRMKSLKYLSIQVYNKEGSVLDIHFLGIDFKSMQTNYTYDVNNTNGLNVWKVVYNILDRRKPDINLDDYIKQYKREINISKLD